MARGFQSVASVMRSRQRGAIAMMAAFTLPVMLGFVGLVYSSGELMITRTQLQVAADACALSAAIKLADPGTDRLASAQSAGIAIGALNRVGFAGTAIGETGSGLSMAVDFSASADGPFQSATSASASAARYARCVATHNGFLATLLRNAQGERSSLDVSARSVAGLAPADTACAMPMSVCASSPGNTANPMAGSTAQQTLLEGAWRNADQTGFRWIAFGKGNTGTPNMKSWLQGNGKCPTRLNIQDLYDETGSMSPVLTEWNDRAQDSRRRYVVVPVVDCAVLAKGKDAASAIDLACVQMLPVSGKRTEPGLLYMGKGSALATGCFGGPGMAGANDARGAVVAALAR